MEKKDSPASEKARRRMESLSRLVNSAVMRRGVQFTAGEEVERFENAVADDADSSG